MHARLRGPNNLLLLQILSNFPCLADEIAEPRPYMKIKVAAFTVSEKSFSTYCQNRIITKGRDTETNQTCSARSSTSFTRHYDSCCVASLNHLEQRLLLK